jgi:hypothetical protein
VNNAQARGILQIAEVTEQRAAGGNAQARGILQIAEVTEQRANEHKNKLLEGTTHKQGAYCRLQM